MFPFRLIIKPHESSRLAETILPESCWFLSLESSNNACDETKRICIFLYEDSLKMYVTRETCKKLDKRLQSKRHTVSSFGWSEMKQLRHFCFPCSHRHVLTCASWTVALPATMQFSWQKRETGAFFCTVYGLESSSLKTSSCTSSKAATATRVASLLLTHSMWSSACSGLIHYVSRWVQSKCK